MTQVKYFQRSFFFHFFPCRATESRGGKVICPQGVHSRARFAPPGSGGTALGPLLTGGERCSPRASAPRAAASLPVLPHAVWGPGAAAGSHAPPCVPGPRGRPSLLPCANRSALSGCPLHLPPAPYLFRGLTLGNHFPPLLGHPHWSRCTVMLPIPDAHLEPCLYLATEPRLLSRSWLHRPLCALLSSQPRSNQAFICPVLLKGHRQPPVDRSNG